MSRKLILALALFAAGVQAQQSVDISADDYAAGKGDARLSALAKQAAADGKRVVITAPKEWHKSITAKLGKSGNVVLREGFYESVLARVEDVAEAPKPAKAPEPVAAPVRAAPVAVAPAPVAAPPAPRPVPPVAAPAPAPKPAPAVASAPAAKPASAPVAKPAQPLVSLPATPAKPAAPDEEAIRDRMRQSLIEGRAAQGPMAVSALVSGDVIYVDEPVRGVVRREGTKAMLYWLDGDLDLRRTELKPLAANRYQVLGTIIGEGRARSEFDASASELLAKVPVEGAAEREKLEQAYNNGRNIRDQLTPAQLVVGDVLYASGGAVVVARREGRNLARYWLDGLLDLRQEAIRADGEGKYRVIGNVAR